MNRHLAPALGALALGALLLQPVTAMADPPAHARSEHAAQHRDDHERRHRDSHHDRQRHGHGVHRLPPRPRVVHHHGHRYCCDGGAWYRPYGPRYRAGPVCYVWHPRARGHVLTDRPYRYW